MLPRCSAAVLSGALGSVAASLAAGIPVVIHPQLWDQFWHGRQVTKPGVGAIARKPATIAAMIGLLCRKAKSSSVFVTKISATSTAAPLTASPAVRAIELASGATRRAITGIPNSTEARPSSIAHAGIGHTKNTNGAASSGRNARQHRQPTETTVALPETDHGNDRHRDRQMEHLRHSHPGDRVAIWKHRREQHQPDPSEAANNGEHTGGARAGCRNRGPTGNTKMRIGNLTRAAESSDGQRDRFVGFVTGGSQLLDAFTQMVGRLSHDLVRSSVPRCNSPVQLGQVLVNRAVAGHGPSPSTLSMAVKNSSQERRCSARWARPFREIS